MHNMIEELRIPDPGENISNGNFHAPAKRGTASEQRKQIVHLNDGFNAEALIGCIGHNFRTWAYWTILDFSEFRGSLSEAQKEAVLRLKTRAAQENVELVLTGLNPKNAAIVQS